MRGPLTGLLAFALSIGAVSAGEAPKKPPAQPVKPAAAPEKPPAPPAETPGARQKRLQAVYDRAEALYRASRYRDAQTLYAQVALEEPNFERVSARLQDIRTRLADEDRQAVQKQVVRRLDTADLHASAGNFTAAAAEFEAALILDPENARAQRRLAECAGEIELERRMVSIFEETEAPTGRKVMGQAPTAIVATQELPVEAALPADAAPAIRTGAEPAPPPAAPRSPAPAADDEKGRVLLGKAWRLCEGAEKNKNPRRQLRMALDTLSPITLISEHSRDTKDTAIMLRKSIARRLAEDGNALSAKEASRAKLYARYLQADEHFRRKEFEEAVLIASEIVAEDGSFGLARSLQQEARLRQQEEKMADARLEGEIQVEKRFVEAEEMGNTEDRPDPADRPTPNLTRPTVTIASPELDEKLNQRVSVNLIDTDLDYLLDLLFRSTGVNIIYNPETVAGQTITVHVANYPLRQLLDYIARNHGLMFATTEDGVLITTPEEPRLETFVVPLHYGLIDVTEAPPSAAVAAEGGASPPLDPPATSNLEMLVAEFPQLIDWPQGSYTYLDRKMNLLYVRTTRDAYQEVIRMIEPIDKVPIQVLVKTLFIEVAADDYETFGVEAALLDSIGLGHIGNSKGRIESDPDTAFRFPEDIGPGEKAPADSGMNLKFTGFLNDRQFTLVIDALQRTGRSRTLAAPNVICMNNCTALVSVTKDLIYIEDYEVDRADISGTSYGNQNQYYDPNNPNQNFNNNNGLSSEPVIIPRFAEGEDTGFTLDVAPSVGQDTRFITLTINPRIREEVDRISTEIVFPSSQQNTTINGDDNEVEDEAEPLKTTIEQPIVAERSLATKLTVADGATVVLGGLVQSRKKAVVSKVPILSDIPGIGWIFGRDSYKDSRTLLLVFVQAEILTPNGSNFADSGSIDSDTSAGVTTID
ncbi:hypothetical protein HQ560_16870, partial [bacterium]|nr:hypothetical protein [bacterium]